MEPGVGVAEERSDEAALRFKTANFGGLPVCSRASEVLPGFVGKPSASQLFSVTSGILGVMSLRSGFSFLWFIPKGCPRVAGGRSAAETPGREWEGLLHPEGMPDSFQKQQELCGHSGIPPGCSCCVTRTPVVCAPLRPPATFCHPFGMNSTAQPYWLPFNRPSTISESWRRSLHLHLRLAGLDCSRGLVDRQG
jgi:hypothetical protein